MEKALLDMLTRRRGELTIVNFNEDEAVIQHPIVENDNVNLIFVECDVDHDDVDYNSMAAFLNSCIN